MTVVGILKGKRIQIQQLCSLWVKLVKIQTMHNARPAKIIMCHFRLV
jgi:hypothetical protein